MFCLHLEKARRVPLQLIGAGRGLAAAHRRWGVPGEFSTSRDTPSFWVVRPGRTGLVVPGHQTRRQCRLPLAFSRGGGMKQPHRAINMSGSVDDNGPRLQRTADEGGRPPTCSFLTQSEGRVTKSNRVEAGQTCRCALWPDRPGQRQTVHQQQGACSRGGTVDPPYGLRECRQCGARVVLGHAGTARQSHDLRETDDHRYASPQE